MAIWPYMVTYGHIWSYMAICGHTWPYMDMYSQIHPYIAVSGHVWAIYSHISFMSGPSRLPGLDPAGNFVPNPLAMLPDPRSVVFSKIIRNKSIKKNRKIVFLLGGVEVF